MYQTVKGLVKGNYKLTASCSISSYDGVSIEIGPEGNATRYADANNTRDIITNATSNTQAILDKLCQLELDGKQDRINELERQLAQADLRASQTAQNAFIAQGFANEVDQLYNRLSNCPVPSTPVYGRTPIFTCPQNNGCGCNGYATNII